jgi:hypothetical protein
MPVTVQDAVFDILPSPGWGSPSIRKAPKIKFESANGYKHQRERWSSPRYTYPLKWSVLTAAEANTLKNWLDSTASNSFWFLPSTAMWGGVTAPSIKLMRVSDDEIKFVPLTYGYFSVEITLEEL